MSAWVEIAEAFDALAVLLSENPDGRRTPTAYAEIAPDVEQAADQWMVEWIRTKHPLPLTDDLRFALLPRARYAAKLARMSGEMRMPMEPGLEMAVIKTLVLDAWHARIRAMWQRGDVPPPQN